MGARVTPAKGWLEQQRPEPPRPARSAAEGTVRRRCRRTSWASPGWWRSRCVPMAEMPARGRDLVEARSRAGSVEDRPTSSHGYVFLLSKCPSWLRCSGDRRGRRHPCRHQGAKGNAAAPPCRGKCPAARMGNARASGTRARSGRSPRSPTGAHFATMPRALAEMHPRRRQQARRVRPVRRAVAATAGEVPNIQRRTPSALETSPKASTVADCGRRGNGGDIRRGPVVHATTTGWGAHLLLPWHAPYPAPSSIPSAAAPPPSSPMARAPRHHRRSQSEYREMPASASARTADGGRMSEAECDPNRPRSPPNVRLFNNPWPGLDRQGHAPARRRHARSPGRSVWSMARRRWMT